MLLFERCGHQLSDSRFFANISFQKQYPVQPMIKDQTEIMKIHASGVMKQLSLLVFVCSRQARRDRRSLQMPRTSWRDPQFGHFLTSD